MALLLMQPETHLTEQILTREEPETFTLMSFSFECTTYTPQTLPVSVKTHLGTEKLLAKPTLNLFANLLMYWFTHNNYYLNK